MLAFLTSIFGSRIAAWLVARIERYVLSWLITTAKRAIQLVKRKADDKKDVKQYENTIDDPQASVDQKSDAATDFLNHRDH